MNIETKGSLCTGTGALDEVTPGALQWLSEIEPVPADLLSRRFPRVPNLGDLTVSPEKFTPVDLLTSGDPCQSMSEIGLAKASEDERFLWPYVMTVIDRVRPREVFLENVRALATKPLIKGGERGGILKMRLDNLRDAGYEVRWMILGACAVGAPHHRHRWFLRARYVGQHPAPATRVDAKCGAPRNGGLTLLPSPRASDGQRGVEPNRVGRTGTGGTLLDAVAPLAGDWGRYATAIRRWESVIGRPAPTPTEPGPRGGSPRLSAAMSEWMMGYDEGQFIGRSRIEALKMSGNGVVRLQARKAWDMLQWPDA